jgi:hypothetical protein
VPGGLLPDLCARKAHGTAGESGSGTNTEPQFVRLFQTVFVPEPDSPIAVLEQPSPRGVQRETLG